MVTNMNSELAALKRMSPAQLRDIAQNSYRSVTALGG